MKKKKLLNPETREGETMHKDNCAVQSSKGISKPKTPSSTYKNKK